MPTVRSKSSQNTKSSEYAILPKTVKNYQNFLQKVSDTTPSLIAVYNIQTGKYIFVNKAIDRVLGYKPSEWLSHGVNFVSQLVHPDDLQKINAENQRALEKANKQKSGRNPVVHFEFRIKHKNGRWRWLHTYATVFDRDEKGNVRHVLNVSLDITRRKEIEEQISKKEAELQQLNVQLEETIADRTRELTEREERLNEAQQITRMGSWEYELATQKITWSDGIYRIHGRKKKEGEPDYKTFLRYFPDSKLVEAHVQRAVTKGISYKIDTPIIMPDKSLRYIQAIGRPVRNSSGKIVKLYGTAVDITDRKLAEMRRSILVDAGRRLASSIEYETTFQNIIRSTVPGLADWCILDLKRGEKFERILVVHKEKEKAHLAKILKEQYPPDPAKRGGVSDVLRTGKPIFYTRMTPEYALRAARDDKKLLSLLQKMGFESFMILPLITRNTIRGAITFVSASPARRYEKDDLIMATQLSWRIAVAIDNATLYKEAQNAVRIREEFISIASHELKTPVTSMKMYSQILKRLMERRGITDLVPYITKISDQIDKQTLLISDLLDISKLQLGKLTFSYSEFFIQDLLSDVVESVRLLSPRHTITISGTTSKKIFGDYNRISQVVINLLTNAIKYSPKADKILIKLSQLNDTIDVAITDFGIGITKENQKKIFDRFYQVHEPLEKTYPGLGIGLYISSEIIKRHGGTISVRSQKGKGSTFIFSLPVDTFDKKTGTMRGNGLQVAK